MRKQGKKQRRRKKKKREKKACDTEMRRRQSSYGREAIRPGTRREKQRRERGRTIMSTSIEHKKSKHNYCQFFHRHPFLCQTQNTGTTGTHRN